MTRDWPRVRDGSLLILVAAIATGGCAQAQGSSPSIVARYDCAENRHFTVQRTDDAAIVSYADQNYTLARKPSSIGLRYASGVATLIIDRDFAAFVSETVVDLENCRSVRKKGARSRVARAR